MDIGWRNLSFQLSRLLLFGLWSFFILLHIEFPQQHDRFFPEDASIHRHRVVDARTTQTSMSRLLPGFDDNVTYSE
jgi:hypothetical protein